ncbi:MAG: hypothetical protein HMLKMBBP_00628 [Planctomycetes bacterium]|nr:hypothetical protein [Planctomycetota bacterium]
MQRPAPTPQHDRLAAFEGVWEGGEILHSGPARAVASRATARYEFRRSCGGFFLLLDYEQRQDGEVTYGGHGVYGFDAAKGTYTGQWFDTMGGFYETPSRGVFEGNTLTLVLANERFKARYCYEFVGADEMTFQIHVHAKSGVWEPYMSGRYRRAS